MDFFSLSLNVLNIVSFGYVIASFIFIFNLIIKKRLLFKLGFGITAFSFLLHTSGLIFRWIASGWGQPPWSNLYESLVFFTWGIMLMYHIFYFISRVDFIAVFAVPLAMLGMGLAAFHPVKEIEPLVPALQSYWIHIHVACATFAYGSFIVATAFAIAYLLKKKVNLHYFELGLAFITFVAVLALCYNSPLFTKLSYTMDLLTKDMAGNILRIPQDFTRENSPPLRIHVPLAGIFLIITLSLAFVTTLLNIFGFVKNKVRCFSISSKLFFVMLLFLALSIGDITYQAVTFKPITTMNQSVYISLSSNTFELGILVLALFLCIFFLLIKTSENYLDKVLPDAETLFNINHKAILLGFPIMALLLTTGAIWAHYAWGRYWGWDPKEVWALITWLIYAIYLHTIHIKKMRGEISALISIIGFFSVLFTYLGVNLVISGLHSYATG